MTVCFYEVETAVREFYHRNSKTKNPVVEFPWPYGGSYFVKKKKTRSVIRFAVV